MITSFIITLRETLEAALIVGIVIGFLKRTKQYGYYSMVWYGVAAGVVLSVLGAWLFQGFVGGFIGRTEQLFEGLTMIIGSILVTTLIVWVMHRQNISEHLNNQIAKHLDEAKPWGIFFMILIAVLREGVEMVIFIQSINIVSQGNSLLGVILGIIIAVGLGIALYLGSLKINLKKFFTITGAILILFAAGLLIHGVHELQEAGILPIFVEQVWNINNILNENGHLGSFLRHLFGYNANPSLLEVITYVLYMLGISYFWRRSSRQKV